MTIKRFLIGAACAMAACITSVQAADIVVAADPEPVEYVQVCDTYGDGFFYIPGSETCLKVSGDVRVRSTFTDNEHESATRARLLIDAKNGTEYGDLTSSMIFSAEFPDSKALTVDKATISLAGFNIGYDDSAWTRFSQSGFDVVSFDGYTGSHKVQFVEYAHSVDLITLIAGVEQLTGNSKDLNPYAGIELSLGDNLSAFGMIAYDDAAKATAGRVGAKASVDQITLGAWAAFDDGKSLYVNGSGKYDYGVFASFQANEKLTLLAGYTDSDDATSTSYATFGAKFAVADGLTFTPEVRHDFDGDKDTVGRLTLVRSY